MKILSLSCDKCGAPLDVPAKVRHVTCTYCDSRLEIHKTKGAAYTSVLESIDDRTAQIAEDVAALRREQELERIDREWEQQRRRHLIKGKNGYHVPTRAGSVAGGVIAAVFGLFWTIMAGSMGFPFPFPLFGVLFIGVAIFGALRGATAAGVHERNQRRYEQRRREVLRRLRDRDD